MLFLLDLPFVKPIIAKSTINTSLAIEKGHKNIITKQKLKKPRYIINLFSINKFIVIT